VQVSILQWVKRGFEKEIFFIAEQVIVVHADVKKLDKTRLYVI